MKIMSKKIGENKHNFENLKKKKRRKTKWLLNKLKSYVTFLKLKNFSSHKVRNLKD